MASSAKDESTPPVDEIAGERDLVALRLSTARVQLEPAPRWRDWMNATDDRWANRCLPLLMANESGWVVLNPVTFAATWTGEDARESIVFEFSDSELPDQRPASHFGYGIITWAIPYLFRTPAGYNVLARGPANWPKDGACALEGLVETDWSVATFTMNWKLTRADHPVRFERGEPICMVVPQRRGELREFRPIVRDIRAYPETLGAYRRWEERRHDLSVRKFLGEYSLEHAGARDEWQADYFRGTSLDGAPAPTHETQLRLPGFSDETAGS